MKKKLLSLLLLASMSISVLAGCSSAGTASDSADKAASDAGSKTDEDSSADETGSEDAPQTVDKITWYLSEPTFSVGIEEWGKDRMSAEIQEKFGIEIEFVTAADDSGTQLSAYISAGDLPDVISTHAIWDSKYTDLINQMAQADMLYSYNELLETYLTEEEQANFRKDILNWYALGDGKTYGYPNCAYSSEDIEEGKGYLPNRCIVVRADMLEQLGNPSMESPEDFLNVCERAVDEIGTYNGVDVIGLQLNENGNEAVSIVNQYFAVPWETEDGQAYSEWTAGTNKESYAFLNEAYRRGLVLDANYTDTREGVKEKVAAGRVFALIAAPQDYSEAMKTLYESDPNAYYVPVVLRNANGDDPTLGDLSGWGYQQTIITKECAAVEKVIKFISWLCGDEGAIQMMMGWEGETFEYLADGTMDWTEEFEAELNSNPNAKKELGINSIGLFVNPAYEMNIAPADLSTAEGLKTWRTSDQGLKEGMDKYSYQPMQSIADPNDPNLTKVQEEITKRDSYLTIAEAEVLTATSEEAFEAKYAEVQETPPTVCDMDLITTYNNDNLQRAKEQLGVDYFFPPYKNK